MALTDEHRRISGTLLRAVVGVLTLVIGIAAISCSAPTKDSSNDPSANGTATTAVDAGAGPTSITKTFRTIEVAKGFDKASNIVSRPMRNQLWVTLRTGAVRVIEIETAWNLELGQTQRNGFKSYPNPIFDLSGDISTEGERGLLGIAFSTDARTLFLSYVNRKGELVVASWFVNDPAPPPVTAPPTTAPATTVPEAPPTSSTTSTTRATTTIPAPTTTQTIPILPDPVVDPASKRVLLTIPHEGNSNYSGQLTLGRDGYLYIGVGDSPNGSADKTAQNPDSLLGKILRIDPSGEKASATDPYAIPPSNPFSKSGVRLRFGASAHRIRCDLVLIAPTATCGSPMPAIHNLEKLTTSPPRKVAELAPILDGRSKKERSLVLALPVLRPRWWPPSQ